MFICNSLEDLKKHYREIHRKRPESKGVSCDLCGKVVKVSAMNNHKMKFHGISKHTILQCPICTFKAVSQKGIDKHVASNHKKFPCDICGAQLTGQGTLLAHK